MARPLMPHARSLYDFGPLAEGYENWYLTPEGHRCDRDQQHAVQALLGDGPHQGRLLDVGCGTGHWSRFFRSLGFRVQGMDLSEEMIRVARKLDPDCEFEVADVCKLPIQDASFDAVIAMAMLEFTAVPAIVLGEMARCVKPDGRLMVGTLNRDAPLNQKRLSRSEQPYASGRLLSPRELWDLLAPWGRPRMLVSSDTEMNGSIGQIVDQRSNVGRMPNGSFLVAEVRR